MCNTNAAGGDSLGCRNVSVAMSCFLHVWAVFLSAFTEWSCVSITPVSSSTLYNYDTSVLTWPDMGSNWFMVLNMGIDYLM